MIRLLSYSIVFSLIISSCKVSNLEITNSEKYKVSLEGVNGFDFVHLLDLNEENILQKDFFVDYSGLALIKYQGGQIYPIFINRKKTKVSLFEPNTPPQFIDSPENDFLYQWLGDYRRLQNNSRMLDVSIEELGEDDSFTKEIKKEKENLERRRLMMLEDLEGDEFLAVKKILQARVLNESGYGIKTRKDLIAQKEKVLSFVKKNLAILKHSDMLIEICKQYLMMNEYVISSKSEMYDQINKDAKDWMELVSPDVPKEDALKFVVKNFYARSMVGIANSVYESQESLFLDESTKNVIFGLGEKLDKLHVRLYDSPKLVPILKSKKYKIFSLVGKDDIISKVATISLARDIENQKTNIPVIVLPKTKLTPEHYMMDKMYAKALYFVDETNAYDDYSDIPLFVLLDDENKVIMISRSRRELNQRISE